MGKLRRLARLALSGMTEHERQGIKRQAKETIKPPPASGDIAAREVAIMLCKPSKPKEYDTPAEKETASVSAAWDRLGDLLTVSGRPMIASLPSYVRRLMLGGVAVSDWLSPAAVSHCYHWVVRRHGHIKDRGKLRRLPVARQDSKRQRYRDYPLGYASARGGWRYRAGAERTAVQGYTGKVQPVIRHEVVTAYVDPAVQAAAIAAELDPAVAVKWHRADQSQADAIRQAAVRQDVYEPVDLSLQAAGINAGKGFARPRHGKVYDPRDFTSKLRAMAAKAQPDPADTARKRQAVEQARRQYEK